MKLSVILVNYNVCDYIELALRALLKAGETVDVEFIVVDNASTDDSKTHLPALFPQVQFIWLEKNVGFSSANNLALKQAVGSHVLFINPDTMLAENTLIECMNQFKHHPETAAIGIYMIDGNGNYLPESKRGFPDPLTSFFKLSGISRFFPKSAVVSRYYLGHLPVDRTASVDVLSGAYMLVSKKMLDRVGGFDEKFFMYGEDIDLSIRVKKTGFKNIYLPSAKMLHFKGTSTEKDQPDYRERFYGAMTLFAEKYFSDNRFSLSLLKAAIWLAKKRPASIRKKNDAGIIHQNLLIVATQDRFNEMLHRIKMSKDPIVITGRVAVHEDESDLYSCTLSELPEWLKSNPNQTILFCESPTLSFFEIIRQMERLKNQAKFLLHAENSRCILGADGYRIGVEDEPTESILQD